MHGNDTLYDLIGYGIQPLFGDDIKYLGIKK
jgi:hypothetical protein